MFRGGGGREQNGARKFTPRFTHKKNVNDVNDKKPSNDLPTENDVDMSNKELDNCLEVKSSTFSVYNASAPLNCKILSAN